MYNFENKIFLEFPFFKYRFVFEVKKTQAKMFVYLGLQKAYKDLTWDHNLSVLYSNNNHTLKTVLFISVEHLKLWVRTSTL